MREHIVTRFLINVLGQLGWWAWPILRAGSARLACGQLACAAIHVASEPVEHASRLASLSLADAQALALPDAGAGG